MNYLITESQYEQLSEMIKLDIKVGDTIMGGKFKNKKIVVKTIGKNDKGDITINGKPLLRFRIIK
jgi:co-chaperonin GroES (HSP10)